VITTTSHQTYVPTLSETQTQTQPPKPKKTPTNLPFEKQWALYETLKNLTTLPIIPKGIQTVEDAQLAIAHGAPAIFVSNHGGRQLDTAQTPFEIILEIYNNAPEVFSQTEVLVDGGVRYGTDVLKMLAMGVKAVGMGRPYVSSSPLVPLPVVATVSILESRLEGINFSFPLSPSILSPHLQNPQAGSPPL
jgi:hypothetical protein